jgi:hypothetical protein
VGHHTVAVERQCLVSVASENKAKLGTRLWVVIPWHGGNRATMLEYMLDNNCGRERMLPNDAKVYKMNLCSVYTTWKN